MGYNILIVDDDPMIRHIVETILVTEGHKVTPASSGSAVLEILNNTETPSFDLVISDVLMPEMTGLQLLKHLKEKDITKNVPVIMLTGEAKTDDILGGYNLGADYYMTKPFTRQQLLQGLVVVLEK